MKSHKTYFDIITLVLCLVAAGVSIYYYCFEYLVAATLLGFQTFRVISYNRYSQILEEELEEAEEYLGH